MSQDWSPSTGAHGSAAPGLTPGGPDRRTAARCTGGLLLLGAAMGSLNLLVDGLLRAGTPRTVYAVTMLGLTVLGTVLVLAPRAGRWMVFGLVLLGDAVYVVVATSVLDPALHAPPLMLLFVAFVAAWFLDPWMFAVHLAVVPLACWAALAPSYDDPAALTVQVVVSAGMLDVVAFVVFVLRTRTQRLLRATHELSATDELTGLANRRSLVAHADRLWRQAHRDGQLVAALVLDLDHFKALNDTHGHATGDAVLQAVAGALRSVVRPADVLARIGGEELVVIGLAADRAEAHQLGERLRSAVREAWRPGPTVTASIGIALDHPGAGADPVTGVWRLVDRADAAMYEAKQAGRDRVELASGPVLPTGPVPRAESDPLPRAAPGTDSPVAGLERSA